MFMFKVYFYMGEIWVTYLLTIIWMYIANKNSCPQGLELFVETESLKRGLSSVYVYRTGDGVPTASHRNPLQCGMALAVRAGAQPLVVPRTPVRPLKPGRVVLLLPPLPL